jgi:hypothetical protein
MNVARFGKITGADHPQSLAVHIKRLDAKDTSKRRTASASIRPTAVSVGNCPGIHPNQPEAPFQGRK